MLNNLLELRTIFVSVILPRVILLSLTFAYPLCLLPFLKLSASFLDGLRGTNWIASCVMVNGKHSQNTTRIALQGGDAFLKGQTRLNKYNFECGAKLRSENLA